jgi:hypothetical protein
MGSYIEHVLDNDGTRYLPYDPAQFTPARMQEYAREAMEADSVQVNFVDGSGHETHFAR